MKNKLKILGMAVAFFIVNPAFAQDMANGSLPCCDKSENATSDSNKQITIDSSEWVTTGNEPEMLSQMTTVVRNKVNHDHQAQVNDQVSMVRTAKHSKKSAQSKQ